MGWTFRSKVPVFDDDGNKVGERSVLNVPFKISLLPVDVTFGPVIGVSNDEVFRDPCFQAGKEYVWWRTTKKEHQIDEFGYHWKSR